MARPVASIRRTGAGGHVVRLLLAIIVACWATGSSACPFCTSLPRTISDDLAESAVAVVARCESISAETDGIRMCRMRITDVVKGDPKLENSIVEVASFKELDTDSVFWLVAYGDDRLQWTQPTNISTDGVPYLRGLNAIPEDALRRLEYFLGFLEHADELVAADAYNEFAEASMEDIARLSDKLNRQWVISQLRDETVPRHRRRLCWMFLSQCGTAVDTCLFDESIQKRRIDETFDPGMDAAIACFIAIGGERALTRIEKEYLANPDAEYLDSFAAISAIRVHGTELNIIPRDRLATALRHLLVRPELADLVIPDLARWEDWSCIDRMVELFAMATEETSFLKPATVLYLKHCPLPAAKEALDKLRAIDSEAVQQAESSMMMHSGVASVPVPPPEDSTPETPEGAFPNVAGKPQERREASGWK